MKKGVVVCEKREDSKTKERKTKIQFCFKHMVCLPPFLEIQSYDDGDLCHLRSFDCGGGTDFGAFTVHHRGICFKRLYGRKTAYYDLGAFALAVFGEHDKQTFAGKKSKAFTTQPYAISGKDPRRPHGLRLLQDE